ncbi:hypothetical protein L0F63_004494 [Massospora cicadina]|nr:hypothetical protein L0F63_004494 [Massospora cicadina]
MKVDLKVVFALATALFVAADDKEYHPAADHTLNPIQLSTNPTDANSEGNSGGAASGNPVPTSSTANSASTGVTSDSASDGTATLPYSIALVAALIPMNY